MSKERDRLRLGVSACLMGQKVRYDGGDRRQPWITDLLAADVELVPVCPEAAIGLGIPREPIHLVGDPARPRAVAVADARRDVTATLGAFSRRTARQLADVSGWVLKARSPSCGLEVKVHGAGARATGSGLFAGALRAAHPLMPMIDEEALNDPARRDHFLERVFAWKRWRELERRGITGPRLMEFHAAHKLMLMAHSATRARALGEMIAGVGTRAPRALAARYEGEFMAVLALPATPRKHANVLHHLLGYLKQEIDSGDKAELLAAIEQVRSGGAPLLAPLTLLRHHFRRHPHPWVGAQFYLYPDETERRLRGL